MQISVTFRHVDPTPALRTYAEEKLARVKKYLRRPLDAHVILSVAKERRVAEITVKADHVTLFAQEETHDLYAAIDLAVDKLEHQAQKLKARREKHKGGAKSRGAKSRGGEPPEAVAAEPPPGRRPAVVRSRVSAAPMAVEEAVDRLGATRDDFLVFTNASNKRLAVLYRRKSGGYGLIEPEER